MIINRLRNADVGFPDLRDVVGITAGGAQVNFRVEIEERRSPGEMTVARNINRDFEAAIRADLFGQVAASRAAT